MARIRTIKPEFFEDESLAKLPAHDRLLFIGIWLLADKNGVLEDRPTWIKAKLFPYEKGDTVDVSRMLPRLVTGRYLVRYTADGRNLIAVRNFTKHQRITGKEGQSEGRFPLPPNDLHHETQQGHIGDTPETYPDAQEQGIGNREQGNDMGAKSPRQKSEADLLLKDHPFKISGPKRNHKSAIVELLKKLSAAQVDEFLGQLQDPLWPDQIVAQGSKWSRDSTQSSTGPFVPSLTPDQIAYALEIESEAKSHA